VVTILPLTPQREVVLVRQFRPGPEALLCELPGGIVDGGEAPADAARRELLEETGYEGDLHAVGESLEDAYSTLLRHNFVALDCRKTQEIAPDERPFLDVLLLPLADFRDHLRSGRLTDVETGYLCLDFLDLL
jgi:ADP-ribose pyrophosphatase